MLLFSQEVLEGSSGVEPVLNFTGRAGGRPTGDADLIFVVGGGTINGDFDRGSEASGDGDDRFGEYFRPPPSPLKEDDDEGGGGGGPLSDFRSGRCLRGSRNLPVASPFE